ncbi:hypothetical protein ABZZ04_29615 [Streptomyces sp. NPDC006435]|uniref:hypothetical protein n=1 Tax=Streptomyces sp. NPDC006435 TaxID=3154300 RepID=UPI00339E86FE
MAYLQAALRAPLADRVTAADAGVHEKRRQPLPDTVPGALSPLPGTAPDVRPRDAA